MTRRRNWAAFHRAQQTRAQQALALGQHRPLPLVVEEARAEQQAAEPPEQDDQEDDEVSDRG